MSALRNSSSHIVENKYRVSHHEGCTPSDWHGGEESPVTNSRCALRLFWFSAPFGRHGGMRSPATNSRAKASEDNGATGTAVWVPSDCMAGEVSRVDAGRTASATSENGRDGSERRATNPHSSVTSSPQTDTAAGVFPPPALAAPLLPRARHGDYEPPRRETSAVRIRAGRGQAHGWTNSLICETLPANLSSRLFGIGNASRAATSGRCATIHPNAPSALSRWHSQCRRGLMNSFLRSRIKPSKQALSVFNILSRPSLLVLHVENVTRGFVNGVQRNSAAGAQNG